MRGAMILAGTELIQRFSWGVVRFRGLYRVRRNSHAVHQERGGSPRGKFYFRLANKHLALRATIRANISLFATKGKIYATPLFLVLLVVEITDITLAIDSIPAIFGITQDPFIVYTSNGFRDPWACAPCISCCAGVTFALALPNRPGFPLF